MADPRCLIVDADRASAERLAGIMERHGFVTNIIGEPFEALRDLRSRKWYDLVLFDLSAPTGDGRFVLDLINQEMPDVIKRTVIVATNPLAAADVAGAAVIIGKSDLKPLLAYLGKTDET